MDGGARPATRVSLSPSAMYFRNGSRQRIGRRAASSATTGWTASPSNNRHHDTMRSATMDRHDGSIECRPSQLLSPRQTGRQVKPSDRRGGVLYSPAPCGHARWRRGRDVPAPDQLNGPPRTIELAREGHAQKTPKAVVALPTRSSQLVPSAPSRSCSRSPSSASVRRAMSSITDDPGGPSNASEIRACATRPASVCSMCQC